MKKFSWKNTLFSLILIFLISGSVWSYFWYQKLPLSPAPGGQIKEGFVGQPRLINPLFSDLNNIDREIISLVFQGLVSFDSRNQITSDLAKDWQIEEEGKKYIVHLKENVSWHDGEPFTADDVIFTYQSTQHEKYNGPEKNAFQGVKMEKNDELTITFTLEQPFAPFLENLTLGIIPQHLWSEIPVENWEISSLNLRPIGTGPASFYKIKFDQHVSNWVSEIDFKLPQGLIDEISLKFYPTYTDLITAIKLSEIDNATLPDQESFNNFQQWSKLVKNDSPIFGQNEVLFFNTRIEKFTDRYVRQTIASIIYEAEEDLTLNTLKSYNPIPRNSWAFNQEIDLTVNSEVIMPETISLKTLYAPQYLEIAHRIQSALIQKGTQVKIEFIDQLELEQVFTNRNFETILLTLEVGRDPDQYIYWHSTQAEYPHLNLSGISDARLDKALEEGRQSLDLEKRKEAYADFQKYFERETPAVFLSHPNLYYLSSSKIKSLNLRNFWTTADRFDEINNWYIKEKKPFFPQIF